MSFSVGQTVVHPNHGAAVIERKEDRELAGETRQYLVFTVSEQDLTLKVPADVCEDVGIRPVIGADDADAIFDILCEDTTLKKGAWARQFKARQKAVQSGDPQKVAEVARDLAVKHRVRGRLSAAEMRLRDKATKMLVGELAAALDEDPDTVLARVETAVEASSAD